VGAELQNWILTTSFACPTKMVYQFAFALDFVFKVLAK
jgi:hypothetical protein